MIRTQARKLKFRTKTSPLQLNIITIKILMKLSRNGLKLLWAQIRPWDFFQHFYINRLTQVSEILFLKNCSICLRRKKMGQSTEMTDWATKKQTVDRMPNRIYLKKPCVIPLYRMFCRIARRKVNVRTNFKVFFAKSCVSKKCP